MFVVVVVVVVVVKQHYQYMLSLKPVSTVRVW